MSKHPAGLAGLGYSHQPLWLWLQENAIFYKVVGKQTVLGTLWLGRYMQSHAPEVHELTGGSRV